MATPPAEAKYASLVEKNGFYVSLLDLMLLALSRNKAIAVAYFGDEGDAQKVRVRCLRDTLESLTNCDYHDVPAADPSSKDTWIFVGCTADFSSTDLMAMNHFVPAWHRKQLPDEFDSKCNTLANLCQEAISGKEKEAAELADKETDDEEEGEVQLLSVLDEIRLLEKHLAAADLLGQHDLLPKFVPADGNCGLWSLLELQRGLAEGPAFTLEEIAKLRQVLCLQVSSSFFYVQKQSR